MDKTIKTLEHLLDYEPYLGHSECEAIKKAIEVINMISEREFNKKLDEVESIPPDLEEMTIGDAQRLDQIYKQGVEDGIKLATANLAPLILCDNCPVKNCPKKGECEDCLIRFVVKGEFN